jgi:hypothetical protein
MGVIANHRFEARTKGGCSNSEYLLSRTTCCGRYCVEDAELCQLYTDPDRLDSVVLLLRSPDEPPILCPFCGSTDWDLSRIDGLDQVPATWRWACCER